MNRPGNRGMTLMEMTTLIAVSGVLMAGVVELLGQLRRWSAVDTAVGVRAEWASHQLRRDLAAGVPEEIADGLWISGVGGTEKVVTWTWKDGELRRNGRPMAQATTWQVNHQDRRWLIRFTPPGLPQRQIEADVPRRTP